MYLRAGPKHDVHPGIQTAAQVFQIILVGKMLKCFLRFESNSSPNKGFLVSATEQLEMPETLCFLLVH